MRPQKQKYFHRPDEGQWGDCNRTVIACLLDIDRDDVPNFAEQYWHDIDAWYLAVDSFLAERGYRLFVIAYNSSLESMLDSMKYHNKGIYYILTGKSANKTPHCVIGCGDKIVWDPAIDNSGIVEPCDDGYYWIEVLVPLVMTNHMEPVISRQRWECPDCQSTMDEFHHDGDMLAPDATWFECPECGYKTEPE